MDSSQHRKYLFQNISHGRESPMASSQHRKYLFQNISRGGSRDALVHLLPMEPSAKEFQDSDRGEPPNGVRMFVSGFPFFEASKKESASEHPPQLQSAFEIQGGVF